jgi:hypothetical protein
MWDPDDVGPFDGRHYHLAETLCRPVPVSRPRPPIMIGGSGERKTLRLVAQYADSCNLFQESPDEVARKLDVLRRHCDDVGRDVTEIMPTILARSEALERGDVDTFAEEMTAYAKVGVQGCFVMPPGVGGAAWVEEKAGPAARRLSEL